MTFSHHVTIDGDQFIMTIPTVLDMLNLQQRIDDVATPWLAYDDKNTFPVISDKFGKIQCSFVGKEILYPDQKQKILLFHPKLIPLDQDGLKTKLEGQDGMQTEGGSLWSNGEVSRYPFTWKYGRPAELGNTGRRALTWYIHNGELLSMVPLYRLTVMDLMNGFPWN